MDHFKLPNTTKVQRIVPKNAFDAYINTNQKRLFTDKILRITWLNKLSQETLNLASKEIKEIQVFKIELKSKDDISPILDIIDKAIPYHIIFIVEYEGLTYFSASYKHSHPTTIDRSVIDWTFKSDWCKAFENQYSLTLKNSLDFTYYDFCQQLAGVSRTHKKSIAGLVDYCKELDFYSKEINRLKSLISRCKQFNRKVELNQQLRKTEDKLEKLIQQDEGD